MDRNNITSEMLTTVIKCYNRNFSGRYQSSSSNAQSQARMMLLAAENLPEVQAYLAAFRRTNGVVPLESVARQFCTWVKSGRPNIGKMEDTPAPQPEPTPAPTPAPTPETPAPAPDMMTAFIGELVKRIDLPEIKKNISDAALAFVKEQYGPITRRVVVEVGDKKSEFREVLHEKFDTVIKYVANDLPVYLVGPAGSGKNVLCEQVAKALGLKFWFTNAVSQEYQIKGFTDAMGHYQPTQFYHAFTEGGLFMLDELDASIPEVLVMLNAAIANRYFDFPAPIGRVEAHADFRVIAAGNTIGMGADFQYVGRNQLDAASLNRMRPTVIGYDPRIELALCRDDMDLLGFCRAFREAAKESSIGVVVSYRNIRDMATMKDLLDTKELLFGGLVAGLDKHDLTIIRDKMRGTYGKYTTALEDIIKEGE